MKKIRGYYFSRDDERLGYGDNRIIELGITHSTQGTIEICENGLHFSRSPRDALTYSTGNILWGVEGWGDIEEQPDKIVARHRHYLWRLDVGDLLRRFARKCALDVIHLWDAPKIVVEYLKTGDESIREAARSASSAARSAASEAARDAARSAATAAVSAAAWSAARAAARSARSAVRSARSAASAAASAAARSAAIKKQNRRLIAMTAHERKRQET